MVKKFESTFFLLEIVIFKLKKCSLKKKNLKKVKYILYCNSFFFDHTNKYLKYNG